MPSGNYRILNINKIRLLVLAGKVKLKTIFAARLILILLIKDFIINKLNISIKIHLFKKNKAEKC